MKNFTLTLLSLFLYAGLLAQTASITSNPGTSGNIVIGGSNYHVSESIFLDSEVGAGNFLSAATAINHIDFNCNAIGTGSTTIAAPNFKIYLKDVPATTTTLATGVYSTTGYTLVYSGVYNYPAVGWQGVDLTTTYVRTPGTNLQVLIERADNIVHTGNVFNASTGNTVAGGTALTTRRYNAAAAPVSGTTSLTQSNFRPQIQIRHIFANDAGVANIYTLGKLPIPNGTPRTDSCRIVNLGSNLLLNTSVTLTISGANSFTDTKTIASLAPGASANVVFAAYTPTTEGNNNYVISLSPDDDPTSNTASITQLVNKNTWSYAYGSTPSGGIGFTGATGDFVAKFNTNAATAISQISVNFAAGGQPYQMGIWDATGAGGTPGTNLWTSASLTSITGVNVIPVAPAINIAAGNFFVGVKQTGTVNVNFAYQAETPIRANTFYFTSPTGGTAWTDFSPANPFKFMIEPKLILPIDASLGSITLPNTSCLGTETVTAVLTNTGSNTINAGAANVTLRVRGANTFTANRLNTTNIASGGSEVISFTGVTMSNPGLNLDTLFVTLAGDLDRSNDTLKDENNTTPTITAFPAVENAEATTLEFDVFNWVDAVVGEQSWGWQTGNYSNANQTAALAPLSATHFYLFDSYNAPAGDISRLYSHCLAIPAAGGSNCGYQMSFWMSHDNTTTLPETDSMYVSVSTNKGVTWTRVPVLSTGGGLQRHDAALTANAAPIWRREVVNLSAYAGQTIQIGFEGVSKFGNAFGLDDITISSTAASNLNLSTAANNGINLVKTCDDQGWTYYNDPADASRTLFAVQWDPGSTGANAAAKANALARIQLDPTYFSAESIPTVSATYTMRRYWDVNLNGAALTGPVNVRFFYDAAEKTAVDNAASAFALANSGAVETPQWFKTAGSAAFLPNATNVTPVGVQNATALINVNSSNATINGVLYAQFNGITSFSGGTYATGVGNNSVLPIKIEYFKGGKQGSGHVLNWKVVPLNSNGGNMQLQRSSNGIDFTAIHSISASADRMTMPFSYTDILPVKGVNYYRLKLTDSRGLVEYSSIVVLESAGNHAATVRIAPNPAKEILVISFNDASLLNTNAVLTDSKGTIIQVAKLANLQQPLNISNLSRGVYILKFANGTAQLVIKE